MSNWRQQLWLCAWLPDGPLETVIVEQLAGWATSFTSEVSVDAAQALLLEIRGSLQLFGGQEGIRTLLRQGLHVRGHQSVISCAPTARGALWLARAGIECVLLSRDELHQRLLPVPVGCLGWSVTTLQMLRQMGIRTLGECVRLPRQGFARRFGPGRLHELDQAFGRSPELRQAHVVPVHFADTLELPVETTCVAVLLAGFQRLLSRLGDHLQSVQMSTDILCCHCRHPDGSDTELRIRLCRPAASASAFTELLRLRLEAVILPAPVTLLALQARLSAGQSATGSDLLGRELETDSGLSGLLERLRARLGRHAVRGLALVDEYRPERAWRPVSDPLNTQSGTSRQTLRRRPVWILPVPRLLQQAAGQPVHQGTLCLECGPERIETGWWDGDDIRRDYYVARNGRGARLWVYQDLRGMADWYLHGIFC
jgi:protein ImuB